MFDKLRKDNQGFVAVLMALFTGIIIILGISVAVSIGPAIGGPIDETAQDNVPANSSWNATENTDLPSGADIWESNVDIISIAVFVVIAFGAIIGTMLWYVRRQGGM